MFTKVKKLFIEEDEKKVESVKVEVKKTPEVTPVPTGSTLEEVFDHYLPKSDTPDFKNFFDSIGDSTSPDFYKMAFKMLQSINPSITKESLLSSAEQYIKSIDSTSFTLRSQGSAKMTELDAEYGTKISELTSKRNQLESELQEISVQLPKLQKEYKDKSADIVSKVDEITSKSTELKSKFQSVINNIQTFI